MLKRLGSLIVFIFFWIIGAMTLPVVFWAVGGIILTLTVIQVVGAKEGFHSAARFFTGVGAVTLLLATAGFFTGRSAPDIHQVSANVLADLDGEEDTGNVVEPDLDPSADDNVSADTDAAEPVPAVDAKVAIKAAVAAAKKPKNCKSLQAIAAAWQTLSLVPPNDEQFNKAQKAALGLERCRKKAATALHKGAAKDRIKARAALAKSLQKELAQGGLKLKPKTQGKAKNKITFKGNKKVTEGQLDTVFGGDPADEGSVLGRLQLAGFAKVTVSAGKIKRTFELQPPADEAAVTAQLEALGMHQALKL